MTVTKKNSSPGSTKETVKTIAQGLRVQRAPGISLRPLISLGRIVHANLGRIAPRDGEVARLTLRRHRPRRRAGGRFSIPETSVMHRKAAAYWIPAFAGDDGSRALWHFPFFRKRFMVPDGSHRKCEL